MPPYDNDFVHGAVGFNCSNDFPLDYALFGTVEFGLPAALKGRPLVKEKKLTAALGYKGRLLAGQMGRDGKGSAGMFYKLWGFLSAPGDKCGDLYSGTGSATIGALLAGRSVLTVEFEKDSVLMLECYV
jgi:hypothetical protein